MRDNLNRPKWNDVFMAMNFVLKQRSFDPVTKHACIAFSDNHAILSTGYNGPIDGGVDMNVPITRPEKYDWFIHAEDNTILNAAKHGVGLDDSHFIVSGRPCTPCLRSMARVGAKEIIYGPVQSHMISEKDIKTQEKMITCKGINMKEYRGEDFVDVLIDALFDAEKCGIDVKRKINEKFFEQKEASEATLESKGFIKYGHKNE
jgi:dCMP deaminase